MTAKKESLLKFGVFKEDIPDEEGPGGEDSAYHFESWHHYCHPTQQHHQQHYQYHQQQQHHQQHHQHLQQYHQHYQHSEDSTLPRSRKDPPSLKCGQGEVHGVCRYNLNDD